MKKILLMLFAISVVGYGNEIKTGAADVIVNVEALVVRENTVFKIVEKVEGDTKEIGGQLTLSHGILKPSFGYKEHKTNSRVIQLAYVDEDNNTKLLEGKVDVNLSKREAIEGELTSTLMVNEIGDSGEIEIYSSLSGTTPAEEGKVIFSARTVTLTYPKTNGGDLTGGQ